MNNQFFVITGIPRTGTTYASAFLNSQDNVVCLEFPFFEFLGNHSGSKLNILIANTEQYFRRANLDFPLKERVHNSRDLLDRIISAVKEMYGVEYVGFKQTRLNHLQIVHLHKLNVKVIYMTRNINSLLFSYLNRIDHDIFSATSNLKEQLDSKKIIEGIKNNNSLIIDIEEFSRDEISKFLQIALQEPEILYYSLGKSVFPYEINSIKKANYVESSINDIDFSDGLDFLKYNVKNRFFIHHCKFKLKQYFKKYF